VEEIIVNSIISGVIKAFIGEGFNLLHMFRKDQKEAEKEDKENEREAEQKAMNASKEQPSTDIHWEKVGTLFWFGNDLMWTKDMMFRAASPNQVLRGIRNARQYCEDLGFDEKTLAIQQLDLASEMLTDLAGIKEWGEDELLLTQQHYRTVAGYIDQVKFFINAKAKGKQQGFQKL
jgi:hypothetical protein